MRPLDAAALSQIVFLPHDDYRPKHCSCGSCAVRRLVAKHANDLVKPRRVLQGLS